MRLFRAIRNTGVAVRVFSVMGLLMLTSVLVGWSGIVIARKYSVKVTAMQEASQRAILGEQVNGLIYAVVMDSRGVYMAKDQGQVEKFAKPLLRNLKSIEARMSAWSDLVSGDRRPLFDTCAEAVRSFIGLRLAIVDAGRTQGSAAADKLGNNDAARANREAVNRAVVALAAGNASDIEMLAAEMSRFNAAMTVWMPVAIGGAIAAVVLLAVLLVVRGITGPLTRMSVTIRQIATGQLDVVVPNRDQTDEIGRIANALDVFRQQAIENRAMAEARQVARETAEAEKRAALNAMADTIERTAVAAMAEIRKRNDGTTAAAGEMLSLAGTTGQAALAASGAALAASANAQTIAGAAEQLTASIGAINREVSHSTAIIGRAVSASGETRRTLDTLTRTVDRIGAVAVIIGKIAGRTNLLALNATIEAARAGEAGKGFAVVASEVKQLANQTARSTEEIGQQIHEVLGATAAVVDAVDRIEVTIGEIDTVAGAITSAVEQQNAATSEIAKEVSQTATAIDEMRGRNAKVSKDAEQSGTFARRVLDNASGLGEVMAELQAAIIRAVRESTADVDRRTARRADVNVAASVTIPGNPTCACRLNNLSETGALLTGDFEGAGSGAGELRIEGLMGVLPFKVVRWEDGRLRVAFAPEPAVAEAVRHYLASRDLRSAA